MIHEKIIFWDWNGTLLNDASICLSTMNSMVSRRQMQTLSLDRYREVFGFPVIDYYRAIGFDFREESFEDLSVEFIDQYTNALTDAPATDNAALVLKYFADAGKRNIIVSAMEHDMLIRSVEEKGLSGYFSTILGVDNIYAASKSQMALNFVRAEGIKATDIVFIGDTVHDFEVAEEIGCRCILVADGHQSEGRLRATDAEVISTLIELLPSSVRKSF